MRIADRNLCFLLVLRLVVIRARRVLVWLLEVAVGEAGGLTSSRSSPLLQESQRVVRWLRSETRLGVARARTAAANEALWL